MSWLKERWTALCRVCRAKKWELSEVLREGFQRYREAIEVFLRHTHYGIVEPKETFVVTVGVVEGTSDKRRAVVFEGQQVAQLVRAEGVKRITETLYWIGYGPTGYKRFLIHTRTLHRTKGLRTMLDLREVREADLALGKDAPLGRLRPRGLGEVL